jgi:predicted nucleic acid-binding protein
LAKSVKASSVLDWATMLRSGLWNWLAAIGTTFAERILPIDQAIADEWGRMSAKRPVSTIDALLAATAKVNDMTLVTRNNVDVADLGAKVLNPFEV